MIMTLNKVKWFDVCNDYSLDQREKPEDLHLYGRYCEEESELYQLWYYVHKVQKEVHYAKYIDLG